ncbi:MAG: hypothetical protein ACU833_10210 [Gammaproteobacteria bacterium]
MKAFRVKGSGAEVEVVVVVATAGTVFGKVADFKRTIRGGADAA